MKYTGDKLKKKNKPRSNWNETWNDNRRLRTGKVSPCQLKVAAAVITDKTDKPVKIQSWEMHKQKQQTKPCR